MTSDDLLRSFAAQISAHFGTTTVTPPGPTGPVPGTTPTNPPGGTIGNPRAYTLGGPGNLERERMGNGEILSAPLPAGASGQILMGEVPGSPQPRKLEACISRTRGLIDPAGNYVESNLQISQSWLAKVWEQRGGQTDGSNARARGYLWAPPEEGPWFLNMRATFDASISSADFQLGWGNGPLA